MKITGVMVAAGLAASMRALPVQAQIMVDPTRPPTAAAGPSGGTGTEQTIAEPTGLQSILISNGRKLAVINGQTVALGQKLGDATLVAIRENEVVLKTSAGSEVLKLYPQAEKKTRSNRLSMKGSAAPSRKQTREK